MLNDFSVELICYDKTNHIADFVCYAEGYDDVLSDGFFNIYTGKELELDTDIFYNTATWKLTPQETKYIYNKLVEHHINDILITRAKARY